MYRYHTASRGGGTDLADAGKCDLVYDDGDVVCLASHPLCSLASQPNPNPKQEKKVLPEHMLPWKHRPQDRLAPKYEAQRLR